MRPTSLALCFFVACGAWAGLWISGLVPAGLRQPHLHTLDFNLARTSDNQLEITEADRFFLPYLFADFDLRMDVELSEGADLDLLVRQVEPRVVAAEGDDEKKAASRIEPFTGRFVDLRLSTVGDGSGWRTREEALFGPPHDGVGIAAGTAATVWLQARGRQLIANVAGRPQKVFEADDEYGMTTLIVRGGNAVLHSFTIQNLGQPRAWLWSRWTWAGLGALGALVAAAFALVGGSRARWFLGAGCLMVLCAWLMTRNVSLQLAWPAPGAMLSMLLGCLVFPWCAKDRWRWLLAAVATGTLLWFGLQGLEHDSRRVDAVFGVSSGPAPSQALAQLVAEPDGPFGSGGIKNLAGPQPRVFLLGGQLLYNRGAPSDHLEFQLDRELRAARRAKADVISLPTVDGWSPQQWQLFSTFYTGYRPAVIVFGVPRDEAAVDARTGAPRSDPNRLRSTLQTARDWCREHATQLVLFTEASLPVPLMDVLHQAEAEGVTLIVAADAAEPTSIARQLAAAVLPLLHQ